MAVELNCRTGRSDEDKTVRMFEEEVRNNNGEMLIELCELNNLKITNGFYRHKDTHKNIREQETRNLRTIVDYIQ